VVGVRRADEAVMADVCSLRQRLEDSCSGVAEGLDFAFGFGCRLLDFKTVLVGTG